MAELKPRPERWQRTANAIGIGLGVASLGFSVSQISKRPEIALVGLAVGGVLTAALWERRP